MFLIEFFLLIIVIARNEAILYIEGPAFNIGYCFFPESSPGQAVPPANDTFRNCLYDGVLSE